MSITITLFPGGTTIHAEQGENLMQILRKHQMAPETPCGGHGTCGKCSVAVNGASVRSCQYNVYSDITVELPQREKTNILSSGMTPDLHVDPLRGGYLLAFDIGTTTVVCFLMDPQGKEIAVESMLNPQSPYGADVVTRIRNALDGKMEILTELIRKGMTDLIEKVCRNAGVSPTQIGVISVVGNPCMQQLLMGITPENLAAIPFNPAIRQLEVQDTEAYLPVCPNAKLIVVPDISGYIGADTLGCVIASGMHKTKETVLMVDIGTNGEMVLAHDGKMVACSTAAGPALEGANIRFGMRGATGAIDHVTIKDGELSYSIIGGAKATGICGSGLIDAVAVMVENGYLNKRGRVMTDEEENGQRVFRLSDEIYLTQEDISQVQLAKGAIAAGIYLMAQYLGISIEGIDRVLLAGAFGSFLNPKNACRIGLLPLELDGRIVAVGNIAGSGAKMLACDQAQMALVQDLVKRIEFLELAKLPNFQRMFAQNMRF